MASPAVTKKIGVETAPAIAGRELRLLRRPHRREESSIQSAETIALSQEQVQRKLSIEKAIVSAERTFKHKDFRFVEMELSKRINFAHDNIGDRLANIAVANYIIERFYHNKGRDMDKFNLRLIHTVLEINNFYYEICSTPRPKRRLSSTALAAQALKLERTEEKQLSAA